MPGAGNQPAGSSPAGGYVDLPGERGGVPLPDPVTGAPQTGRLIDQKTRQYVFTDDGRAEGMGTVEQLIMIAWSKVKRSDIDPLDSGYENRARAAYITPVQSLIDDRLLAIVDFRMTRFGSNGLQVTIRWADLTTGIESPSTFIVQ